MKITKCFHMIFSILIFTALLFSFSTDVFAEDSVITYDGDAKKFVFLQQDKDLFQNFKNIMPGDTLTQKITINNDKRNNVKVKIFLRAESVEENYEPFLNQLTLGVSQGDSDLFLAPANEQGSLSENILLGTFYSGGKTDLNVTLEVPITLNNDWQESMGVINWVFSVQELPIESDDPKPPQPQTGDSINLYLYGTLMMLSSICLITLVIQKKKRV